MAIEPIDLPPAPAPPAEAGGRGNFLTRQIGGLPVWAWGLVLAGGTVLGLIILPKFLGAPASGSSSTDSSGLPPTAQPDPNNPGIPIPVPPISTGPQGPQGPPGVAGWNPPAVAFTGETYVATKLDDLTLGQMAQNVYGNSAYWQKIAQNNRSLFGTSATAGTRAPVGKPVHIPPL